MIIHIDCSIAEFEQLKKSINFNNTYTTARFSSDGLEYEIMSILKKKAEYVSTVQIHTILKSKEFRFSMRTISRVLNELAEKKKIFKKFENIMGRKCLWGLKLE